MMMLKSERPLNLVAVVHSLSMGGDAHTQAIVESVIGETQTVDENAVTAALGEMGAIAAANAAEEIPDDLDLDGEEPIMDSRFTTTIPDEETTEMVEAYIEDAPESEVLPEEGDDGGLEDDDIGWGVWDPEPESVSEPIVETPESAVEHELPEILNSSENPLYRMMHSLKKTPWPLHRYLKFQKL